MHRLENRIPPPIVAACLGAAAWLAAPAAAGASLAPSYRFALAIAFALAGGAIAGAGSVGFRRAKTTVNPLRPENASSLVTTGVYRLTRNPMYVGLALVLVGVAAWLWWLPALLAAAGFVAYITRFQIRPEERVLGQKFGGQYHQYCASVRRWL